MMQTISMCCFELMTLSRTSAAQSPGNVSPPRNNRQHRKHVGILFLERLSGMTIRRMVFGVFFAFWSLIAGLWLLIQAWHGWSGLMVFLGGILIAYSLTFFLLFFLHWRRAK